MTRPTKFSQTAAVNVLVAMAHEPGVYTVADACRSAGVPRATYLAWATADRAGLAGRHRKAHSAMADKALDVALFDPSPVGAMRGRAAARRLFATRKA